MSKEKLYCPSSYPGGDDAKVFAVVVGSVKKPEVKYLKKTVPVSKELLSSTAPASPTEVFRFTSQCMREQCQHFDLDKGNCTLVSRTIKFVPSNTENLNPCAIRTTCVWWNQEGKAACIRCSQVVRDGYPKSIENIKATIPPTEGKSSD